MNKEAGCAWSPRFALDMAKRDKNRIYSDSRVGAMYSEIERIQEAIKEDLMFKYVQDTRIKHLEQLPNKDAVDNDLGVAFLSKYFTNSDWLWEKAGLAVSLKSAINDDLFLGYVLAKYGEETYLKIKSLLTTKK